MHLILVMQRRKPRKDGAREQMEVKVKKSDDIIEKMLSWIQGLHDERGLLPQFSISLPSPPSPETYSAGRVPIPTRLVNGRGVEYFKLHSPLFPSLLFPSLPFTCLVVH